MAPTHVRSHCCVHVMAPTHVQSHCCVHVMAPTHEGLHDAYSPCIVWGTTGRPQGLKMYITTTSLITDKTKRALKISEKNITISTKLFIHTLNKWIRWRKKIFYTESGDELGDFPFMIECVWSPRGQLERVTDAVIQLRYFKLKKIIGE